jgi:divalent metal cation (Fe/Co/Zn/Cd) transporter
MAHIRKPLGSAVSLNTAVFGLELWDGLRADSLALVMDAVHNFSDELALICSWLAYLLTFKISWGLQRIANLLNSLGLVAISAVLVWQAIDRILHPRPLIGWIPVSVVLSQLSETGVWRARFADGAKRTLPSAWPTCTTSETSTFLWPRCSQVGWSAFCSRPYSTPLWPSWWAFGFS